MAQAVTTHKIRETIVLLKAKVHISWTLRNRQILTDEDSYKLGHLDGLDAVGTWLSVQETTTSNHVAVPAERMLELQLIEAKLLALEHAGVDNWEGYGIAMQSLEKEEEK